MKKTFLIIATFLYLVALLILIAALTDVFDHNVFQKHRFIVVIGFIAFAGILFRLIITSINSNKKKDEMNKQ